MHGWQDLEEDIAELFGHYQEEQDYEQFIAYNDIYCKRGDASASRSKDWRAKKRLDPGWVAKEQARSRARRCKAVVQQIVETSVLEQLQSQVPRSNGRINRRYKVLAGQLSLFGG